MPGKLKEKLKFFESLSSSSHQNSRHARSSIIPDENTQRNNNNNNQEATSPRNNNSVRNSVRGHNESEGSKIPRKSGRFRLIGEDIVYEEEPQSEALNSSSSEDSGNQSSYTYSNKKKKDSLYRVVKLDKDTNEIKEREIDNSKQATRRNSISIYNTNGNNKSNGSLRTREDSKLDSPRSEPPKSVLEDITTITEQLDQIADSQGEVPLVNNRRKPEENESIPQSKGAIIEEVVDATANATVISAPKTPRRLPPITRTPRSPVPPLTIPVLTKTPLSSPALSERSSSLDSPLPSKPSFAIPATVVVSSSFDPATKKQLEEEEELQVIEGKNLLRQLESYLSSVSQKKSQLLQKDFQNAESRALLERQFSAVNVENQALSEQIEWLQLQIEEMNKTRDCQDSLITTLQQELHQSNRLNDELSLKIDQQEQTIRSLENQLKKYKSYASGVQEYEQIISKLNKNMATLTAELKNAQQENSSQQLMLQTLQTDNKQLSQQVVQIEESLLCVICTEKVADCVASPCHHQAVCDTCCRAKNLAQCVLCRAAVHKYLKVYVNWTPKHLK